MNIDRIEQIAKEIKAIEKKRDKKQEKFKETLEEYQLEVECLQDELASMLLPKNEEIQETL